MAYLHYILLATAIKTLMDEYQVYSTTKKAFKWWDKAIKKREDFGVCADLSLTYFEVGKHLLEPSSKYETLNGITAEQYFEKPGHCLKR